MAINQASFFLYPPRHIPSVELEQDAKALSGEPLQIVGSMLCDSDAPIVLNADVLSWFHDRGFSEKESYGGLTVIYRDREETFLGVQEVIELSIPLDEVEFTELYIRFLLTETTPDRIKEWEELVIELGHDFKLQLMDSDDNSLNPCIDFPTILSQNHSFINLSKHFEWQLDNRG